jgi:RHS repeat-associated protein
MPQLDQIREKIHTNVWAGGKLLATYDNDGLHFYFDDPLGTRRAQTDSSGVIEQTCSSLPYGDQLSCVSQPDTGGNISPYIASLTAPTEHHFTGKERDSESGNDYFAARYYSSTMGRFMSPDWSAKEEPVPYAKLDDPQTLNLYAYVGNNPMTKFDADGHGENDDCTKLATNPLSNVSPEVKAAMKKSADATSKSTKDDPGGHHHEESGIAYTVNGKQIIAPAVPGSAVELARDSKAESNPFNTADPNLRITAEMKDVQVDVVWHTHPDYLLNIGLGGDMLTTTYGGPPTEKRVFNPEPSDVDKQHAFSPSTTLNLMISTSEGNRVYLFNNEGVVCKESWKDFIKK